jgi:uncharacterized protein YycO
LVSRLIRWQTRGPYSHASLILPNGCQIEAWSDGVKLRQQFEAHDSVVDRFTVAATDDQVARMQDFAVGELGCAYDWVGDACFVTRTTPPGSSATRWFCSELVFATLAAGGVELFRATAAYEVSPSMLGRSPLLIPLQL